MRPLKARKNEYTFCDLESNVPKNAGLLMTGSHENAPVLFQFLFQVIVRPADGYISVFQPDAFRRGANAGKIFQDEERTCGIV